MYRFLHVIFLALTISLSTHVFAAEKAPWTHESELALVKVGGNTESESYNGKQKTTYTFDLNAVTAAGRYLESKAGSTQTAKSWDASLRYERILSDLWSAFVQQTAESDYFSANLCT